MLFDHQIFSMKISFLITSFLSITFLFGQNKNGYKFIEPNISISYDSNLYSVGTRYSNSVYETEHFEFIFKPKQDKIKIFVKADIPSIDFVSMKMLEESMTKRIEDVKKIQDGETELINYDKQVRKVGDFLCLGFVAFIKPIKSNMTSIICNHISDNDLTEISFIFIETKNLDSCYKIVLDFVSGFKYYTRAQVNYEDSLIKNNYSVSITKSSDTIENFKWRKTTFLGTVKINEQLKHKIKEVRLDMEYGQELFEVQKNGEIRISCNDKGKGTIKKKGQVIIINSFGKNVKVPFEFDYSVN
jgi:hypothetical protein